VHVWLGKSIIDEYTAVVHTKKVQEGSSHEEISLLDLSAVVA
jgi:hypothetical protein